MKSLNALEEFKGFAHHAGKSFDQLSPDDTAKLMISFYSEVRAEDCNPIEDNGDMLLFQWGIYNWGNGESFEYNITRQFILPDTVERKGDDCIWQLSLTAKFEPTFDLKEIGSGYRWCETLGEVENFSGFIKDCVATEHVRNKIVQSIELFFSTQ